jgi:long-subunit fatty acid transport protein
VPESEVYQLNATTIVFYEVTPLISLNVPRDSIVPGELSFGIGYRLNLVTFARQQGERENPRGLDLDLSGYGFKGLRAGMQYRVSKLLSFGAVYRNRVTITTEADEATLLGQTATNVELPFILPAQVGAGIRTDYERLGVAFDAMYTFQEQNERANLSGTIGGNVVRVPNVFDWRNAFTLRFGAEFRLGPEQQLPVRVGYIYDEQVASRAYPSAFGTPPTPTRTFTLGGGYDTGAWEINLALALRSGDTALSPAELAPAGTCPTCGYSGEYAIDMTGLYLDFSTDLEL